MRPRSNATGQAALVTVTQAAQILGISRSTLYAGIRTGSSAVRPVRVGKQWLVPRAALERLIQGRVSGAVEPARGNVEFAGQGQSPCPLCGVPSAASTRRTCSAARTSSSRTGSV
jgi:excisionase family DNA binding protein